MVTGVRRVRLLLLTSLVAAPARAAEPTPAELQALVVKQAALIADLEARVAALEGEHAANAANPPTTPAAPSALASAAPAPDRKTAENPGISVDWSAGAPTFRLADGSSFHVRGRVHVDGSSTSGSRFGSRNIAGTELSSARLGVDGTYGHHIGYKAEVEFAGGATSIKETYISYETKLFGKPLQVFVGNKTGDRSIDGASYDDFVPFFQRTMLATSIGPEKGIMGIGVLAKLAGDDWHIGLDVVGNDPNSDAGSVGDTISYMARATWAPKVAGEMRLHLGGWGYYEDIAKGSITGLTRSISPGQGFNDNVRITMTSILNPRSSTGEGAEIGLIRGPFWAFGEYGRRHVVGAFESRDWSSYVAEAGYFVTGEQTNFSPSLGSWTQFRPSRSFLSGGPGAIELMARYERTSLGRSTVAGSGEDLTLGAGWYLSANIRILGDWVRWKVTNPVGPYVGSDVGNTFNLRFDTTF